MTTFRSLTGLILLVSSLGVAGCTAEASDDSSTEPTGQSAEALTHGGPHLLWRNVATGEVSAWVLSGTTVTGTQSLDWRCGASNGCVNTWKPVDTRSNTILWDNPTTGQLQAWAFSSDGNVTAQPMLDWQCTAASGCSATWKPVGRASLRTPCTGFVCSQDSLLWYNPTSGEVSAWLLNGSHVTGKQALAWRCGPGDGCSTAWRPLLTGDFDGDGATDLLWYNESSGVLSAWLLDGTNVKGKQDLSWQCTKASGCASAWHVVGAADLNGDGHLDLTWHNPSTGEVSTWLLDGKGVVTGKVALSWTCDAGCSSTWQALGYVNFPLIIK